MRAVLDTNVLISGLLWRGAPHDCLLAAEAGLYELLLAPPILEELRQKLIEKFANPAGEADETITGLRRCAALVAVSGRSGWIRSDPADDKFIETALVGNADVIVSGDRHLLEHDTVQGIPILSPRRFLARLASQEGK
jgi:putative PIN family toxin of toxin-antitoxin system